MTPQQAKRIITAAKKRGADIGRVSLGDDYILVELWGPRDAPSLETVTITTTLEGCAPEHFKELIDWQLEAWK